MIIELAAHESRRERARRMREEGASHYEIALAFRVSLSQVRRWLDPKAQANHERWSGR